VENAVNRSFRVETAVIFAELVLCVKETLMLE